MKSLQWIPAAIALLFCGLQAQEPRQVWQPPSEHEVYEVHSLPSACAYLLEQAVACKNVIWLRIDAKALSRTEREKLFYLLPGYRLASLKVYPMSEELFMLMPSYKSCVRMLRYSRGHRDIMLTEQEKEALEIAQRALRELAVEKLPPAEAARALHDWIVLHAAYDKENANFNREYAEGEYSPFDGKYLLLEGKGVCDSYVQAYWLLLQMSGIPCSTVSGYVPKYREGHAWSLVRLGDHWAHVDTTFDDPVPDVPGQVAHTNFDKTDAEMRESRQWQQELFPNTAQTGFLAEQPQHFNTLAELTTWLKQHPLPADTADLVSISELGAPTAATLARVEQAAAAAGTPLTAEHDPLYPTALRLRSTAGH